MFLFRMYVRAFFVGHASFYFMWMTILRWGLLVEITLRVMSVQISYVLLHDLPELRQDHQIFLILTIPVKTFFLSLESELKIAFKNVNDRHMDTSQKRKATDRQIYSKLKSGKSSSETEE